MRHRRCFRANASSGVKSVDRGKESGSGSQESHPVMHKLPTLYAQRNALNIGVILPLVTPKDACDIGRGRRSVLALTAGSLFSRVMVAAAWVAVLGFVGVRVPILGWRLPGGFASGLLWLGLLSVIHAVGFLAVCIAAHLVTARRPVVARVSSMPIGSATTSTMRRRSCVVRQRVGAGGANPQVAKTSPLSSRRCQRA